MINKSRRNLLSTMVGVTAATSVFSLAGVLDVKGLNTSPSVADEYLYVYNLWMAKENTDPLGYLRSVGVDDIDNKARIRAIASAEFAKGKTISIDGFVLSKIEVALLAFMGKKLVDIKWP